VVDEIFVKPGDTVEGGADLIHLTPGNAGVPPAS